MFRLRLNPETVDLYTIDMISQTGDRVIARSVENLHRHK